MRDLIKIKMNPNQTFRLILIVGAVLLIPFALYHRIRSQASGEKLDRRQEGLFILLTLRPVGIAGMLGLVAYMVNPSWMAWSAVPLPVWLRWIGVGIGAMAAGLLIWTLRTLGTNLTDTVVTRREHTLVTNGPYHWVRHPFYDSAALCVLANSLVAANWFIFVMGICTLALIYFRTRTEEENLLARFGDAYRAYMGRTGRFFPRMGA
jgi:protein-S-isoprenylcysteine O-methyltransferase Ste14